MEKNGHSKNHILIMGLSFIIILSLLYIVPKFLSISLKYLQQVAIVLFIGMHLWMMKGHGSDHNHDKKNIN